MATEDLSERLLALDVVEGEEKRRIMEEVFEPLLVAEDLRLLNPVSWDRLDRRRRGFARAVGTVVIDPEAYPHVFVEHIFTSDFTEYFVLPGTREALQVNRLLIEVEPRQFLEGIPNLQKISLESLPLSSLSTLRVHFNERQLGLDNDRMRSWHAAPRLYTQCHSLQTLALTGVCDDLVHRCFDAISDSPGLLDQLQSLCCCISDHELLFLERLLETRPFRSLWVQQTPHFEALGISMEQLVRMLLSQLHREDSQLRSLKSCCFFESRSSLGALFAALKLESCKLTRLDIRHAFAVNPRTSPFYLQMVESRCWTWQMLASLLELIASPSSAIQDLGIPLELDDCPSEENGERCSALLQALQRIQGLDRIKTLRLDGILTLQGAACVTQILCRSDQSSCCCRVTFLEINVLHPDGLSFLSDLPPSARVHIRRLRIALKYDSPQKSKTILCSGLAFLLKKEDSSLFCLESYMEESQVNFLLSDNADSELLLANSLEHNHLMVFFRFPWGSWVARSRAETFLSRNRLYESISREEWVKPKIARLFLCGHGSVGKTTLCKSLLNLQQPKSKSWHPFKPRTVRRGGSREEARTEGLEIHHLSFENAHKLVIFDLAGQQEYHAFHHFFISNTINDLFIVVCKIDGPGSLRHATPMLEYWLRFIISHRSSTSAPKPKVLLVANFFTTADSDQSTMAITAREITEQLRQKYAPEVDFGDHDFGVVATDSQQAEPILHRLQLLARELLESRRRIPKLSYELSSRTLPSLIRSRQPRPHPWKRPMIMCGTDLSCCHATAAGTSNAVANNTVAVGFKELLHQYYLEHQLSSSATLPPQFLKSLVKRMVAALSELHATGEVVFLPPNNLGGEYGQQLGAGPQSALESSQLDDLCIIVDPGWFGNKVVGKVLAPKDEYFHGSSQRTKGQLKAIIRQNKCPEERVEQLLCYMKDMELCYSIDIDLSRDVQETEFFFPAVATNRLEWPSYFIVHDGRVPAQMRFYGRRLKCKDTDKQMIPSGVFSRLQVRLRNSCDESNRQSYRMGFCWSSFSRGGIQVVVRFGGQSRQDMSLQGGATSTSNALAEAARDSYPEWIDILLCYRKDPTASQSTLDRTVHQIMDDTKASIFDICQSAYRSIPTVELEEWVLQNKDGVEDVMSLANVKALISKHGLDWPVEWTHQSSSPVVELLLPQELEEYVANQMQAMCKIQDEFLEPEDAQSLHSTAGSTSGESKAELYAQLPDGPLKLLCDIMCAKMDARFGPLMLLVNDIGKNVNEIGKNVLEMKQCLHQMELNIVTNCSTRLLTKVLVVGAVPTFPYLVATSDGKLKRLESLVKEKARLHFLCESPKHGPHKVDKQTGKEVVLKKGILTKAAPVLVPALRVICCAASFVANVYLPGIAPDTFKPFEGLLQSLDGISSEDLQSEVLTKALDALFGGIDGAIEHLNQHNDVCLSEKQMKEGICEMMSYEDVDMHKDFGLYLVDVGSGTNATHQTRWVCEAHSHHYNTRLKDKNPFR